MKIGVLKTILSAVFSVIGLVITLPVLLLGVPFWIMSALVEAARKAIRAVQPAHTPWFEMMDFEPGVGWKPKPNLNIYAEGDPPFHVTTDERGWRCQTRLEDSDVVVFGDATGENGAVLDRHCRTLRHER